MPYIDCFLVPVSRANKSAYEDLARMAAVVAREYGAVRVVECWLDDAGPEASSYHATQARLDSDHYASFVSAASAREDETVAFSLVEWPDKASRDAGMERLSSDPRMQFADRPAVFDGRRLIAGGFVPMPCGATAG